jgi:hypothetical protein
MDEFLRIIGEQFGFTDRAASERVAKQALEICDEQEAVCAVTLKFVPLLVFIHFFITVSLSLGASTDTMSRLLDRHCLLVASFLDSFSFLLGSFSSHTA